MMPEALFPLVGALSVAGCTDLLLDPTTSPPPSRASIFAISANISWNSRSSVDWLSAPSAVERSSSRDIMMAYCKASSVSSNPISAYSCLAIRSRSFLARISSCSALSSVFVCLISSLNSFWSSMHSAKGQEEANA